MFEDGLSQRVPQDSESSESSFSRLKLAFHTDPTDPYLGTEMGKKDVAKGAKGHPGNTHPS